jgi:hypothetical protein
MVTTLIPGPTCLYDAQLQPRLRDISPTTTPPEWVEAVWTALLERYAGRPVRFKVLAGRFYRDKLVQRIEDYPGWTVEVPLAGLGIGRQIAWLKAHTTR